MKTAKAVTVATVSILAILGLAVGHAKATLVTYANSNYGLVGGEPQSLTVDNPSPATVDQFTYYVTGAFNHTTPALTDGFAYDIRISGRAGIGGMDTTNNATPDAAWDFVNFQNLDLVHVPTMRYPWVDTWGGIVGRRPYPDQYTTSHVYDFYVEGHGAGLTFSFFDSYYGDNSGSFQVYVSRLGPVVAPEPTVLVLLACGGTMVLRRKRA